MRTHIAETNTLLFSAYKNSSWMFYFSYGVSMCVYCILHFIQLTQVDVLIYWHFPWSLNPFRIDRRFADFSSWRRMTTKIGNCSIHSKSTSTIDCIFDSIWFALHLVYVKTRILGWILRIDFHWMVDCKFQNFACKSCRRNMISFTHHLLTEHITQCT